MQLKTYSITTKVLGRVENKTHTHTQIVALYKLGIKIFTLRRIMKNIKRLSNI